MKLRYRFSLLAIWIITFLIVTPLLVLYARGFQIDWKTRSIVKTGALVVQTDPTKANIFINDKLESGLTPQNIRFLIPGDYNVRIEKTGYLPWTKRLTIRSQFVTWVTVTNDLLTLFFSQPKLEQTWPALQTSVSKTGNELLVVANQTAQSINTGTGDVTELGSITGLKLPTLPAAATVTWTDASNIYQALQSRNNFGLTDKQIAKIQSIESNGSNSAVKIDGALYSLSGPVPALLDNNVSGFTLDNDNLDNLWYIQANFLKRYNFNSGRTEIISKNTPLAATAQIIRGENNLYLLLDRNLYVLNDNFEKIYDNAANASWDPVAKQLLFGNSNEILIYNPTSKNTDLIMRSTTAITNPVLNQQTGYIFFQNEGKLKAIELDGRDRRNVYTFLNAPNGTFSLSIDGRTLYTITDSAINKYAIR